MNTPRSLVAVPTILSLLACVGGATLGENEAGGDGWLDHEDPRTEATDLQGDGLCAWTGNPYVGVTEERAYALLSETDDGDCAELLEGASFEVDRKTVWGLRPGEGEPTLLLDVTGHEDVRLLDTSPGLLLMGQVDNDGTEALYVLDHHTLDVVVQRQVSAKYWGTRTAPSRDYVVVADNNDPMAPITVIDPTTLDTARVLDLDTWGEAMWGQQRDRLAAIAWGETLDEARLVVWDFDDTGLVAIDSRPTDHTAAMPQPLLDLSVAAMPVIGFGFSWIGWHPDDTSVVFPVMGLDGDHELLVLDVPTGDVRHVPDVSGPVAFTPDGSTIVAWDPERDTELVLVDAVTLQTERLPLTLEGTPSFFVSHDGNQVVIADAFGEDQLQIVDLDTGASTTLETRLPLHTMTSRDGHDEVYTMHDGLWRIDLVDAEAERVELDWTPEHVVWMPESDLLYLDDAERPRMVFWDPTLQATLQTADLPGEDPAPVAMRDLSRPPQPAAARSLIAERLGR